MFSKEEVIQRFKDDNPSFDDERATDEVTRFMMDAEVVNAYIQYRKNPRELSEELEASLTDPQTLFQYAAFLFGGLAIGNLNTNFIQPKLASGEWHLPWQQAIEATNDAAFPVSQIPLDAVQAVSDVLNV